MSDTLIGKARVHTKAASEMLIRRRLETVKRLVTEYDLSVDVTLVTSNCNLADRLTCVSQRWYDTIKKDFEPVLPVCAASVEEVDEIMKIHHCSEHPGVRSMCYFVWLTNLSVPPSAVRAVAKGCQMCQSVDPTQVKWQKGKLEISSTWSQAEYGYNTLRQPAFSHTYRLWTHQIRSLATIAAAGLFKCHPPVSVL